MAPQKRPKPEKTDSDSDQVVQAVVLADSFNERFMPLTFEKPRCLLPLCNVPLIEYTLEFLAVSGVEEVFIFCTAHAKQIEQYLKWRKTHTPFIIHTIQASECTSVGDALRELDAHQLITTDFILVNGDVVSNMNLSKALEAHRALKKVDKNAIMTMVLKEASAFHPSRAKGESSVFVLDAATNECVHYEPVEAFPQKRRVQLDQEVFKKHPEVQFRNDLIDTFIDICSVEVPALLTENFDYQTMRKDFVHNVLTSDLLGKTIYAHIISDEYAGRVKNGQMYDAISKDVLSRWTFPMVPDSNLQEKDAYEHLRGGIYKEQDVVLSRSCVLGDYVQIGAGSRVGENARISGSVIGRRCNIGPGAVIEGAYLWDDVVVGAMCSVRKSILANGVRLEKSTHVQRGCLVSFNVVLGPDITLPRYSKVSLRKQPKEDNIFGDDDAEEEEDEKDEGYDTKAVGENGQGYIWAERADEEDEEDPRNKKISWLGFDTAEFPPLDVNDDDDDSASDYSESDEDLDVSEIGDGFGDGNSVMKGASTKAAEDFRREVRATVERALAEGHSIESAVLELHTLRMAYNGSYEDVREVIVPVLMGHVDLEKEKAASSLKALVKRWGQLLKKVMHSEDDQVHAIIVLQKHCAQFDAQAKLFAPSIQLLYDMNVLEEEAILKWYESERARTLGESESKIRERATKFVEWLQEADEEDDDDDEDEDEDDE